VYTLRHITVPAYPSTYTFVAPQHAIEDVAKAYFDAIIKSGQSMGTNCYDSGLNPDPNCKSESIKLDPTHPPTIEFNPPDQVILRLDGQVNLPTGGPEDWWVGFQIATTDTLSLGDDAQGPGAIACQTQSIILLADDNMPDFVHSAVQSTVQKEVDLS